MGKAYKELVHALSIDEYRNELLKDAAIVPEVDFWALINAVLPRLQDWEEICQAVSSQMIAHNADKYRWNCLPEDPKDLSGNKTKVLRFVSQIFEGIEAIESAGNSGVTCTVARNTTPFSTRFDSSKSRPDAYLRFLNVTPRSSKKPPFDWADVILPIEFEESSYDGVPQEDFINIIWSMHRLMCSDPRRRFAFGLTVKGTIVRLWFTDRCGVVASHPFDINENWRALVRIMVAIIRAPEHQLGYDPDMRRVPLKNVALEPQYDITVRTGRNNPPATVYRTVEMLFDAGVDSMLGGGTRVWKVQKVVDGAPRGPYYALKDVWVRPDRVPEHVILREIREDQVHYGQYFLTVLDAGFVPANPDDPHILGNSQTIRCGQMTVTSSSPLQLLPRKSTWGDGQITPQGKRHLVGRADNIPAPEREQQASRHLNDYPLHHYRIVFEEVGIPVHDLRSFDDVLVALEGGSEGLHALHLSGRVHRDVSTGNIMLVRDPDGTNPRGVILDFEYVKSVDNPGPFHDEKPGIAAFRSVEVESGRYSNSPNLGFPSFRYNALHDLESVWWIFMFMIFFLVHPDETRTQWQGSRYYDLFESPSSWERRALWMSTYDFHALTNHLIATSKLVRIMFDWLTRLKATYAKSYTTNGFHVISDDVLEEARQDRMTIFGQIRKTIESYPSPCGTLSDLPSMPNTPEPE